jgi:katanin p80 WD40 repeat-containing subunit B1
LKIWDIRKKGCIQTYKGHSKGINTIHFSPDGRWVISGGADGLVKLWDLTAGKLLHDFAHHEDAITALEFHPHEFLLATGSKDCTVKFWDLETFEIVSSSDSDSSIVKSLSFSPDGECLFSASNDCLRVWGWEPIRCFESLDVSWNDISDMQVSSDQLVCCSIVPSQSISIWMLNPQKIRPLSKEIFLVDSSTNSTRLSLDNSKTSEALKEINNSSQQLDEQPKQKPNEERITSDQQKAKERENTKIASFPEKPIGIDPNDFIKSASKGNDIIEELMKPHTTLCNVMNSRLSSIKVIRNIWAKSDAKEAIDVLGKLNDPAVVVDILNVLLGLEKNIFSLDICNSLLPILGDLLLSQYDEHTITSLKTISILGSSFGTTIRGTLDAPSPLGVDLSREERLEKCKSCYTNFQSIKNLLEESTQMSPKVNQIRKEVLQLIRGFVS